MAARAPNPSEFVNTFCDFAMEPHFWSNKSPFAFGLRSRVSRDRERRGEFLRGVRAYCEARYVLLVCTLGDFAALCTISSMKLSDLANGWTSFETWFLAV